MLRSASSLSVKSGLLLLVLSSVVLSVATATESESHSLAPVEGGTQSVIAEGDFLLYGRLLLVTRGLLYYPHSAIQLYGGFYGT